MPFLRRRGNLASETDIRRHSVFDTPRQSNDNDENCPPSPSKPQMPSIEYSNPLSQQLSHASEFPDSSAESTSMQTDSSSRFRRFSLLRYRNASDPQLSLRAKQQAEKPPPVPRRIYPPVLHFSYSRTCELLTKLQHRPSSLLLQQTTLSALRKRRLEGALLSNFGAPTT